jgi:succinate dehydrogenase/fumarate reductase flavoprotein subunit
MELSVNTAIIGSGAAGLNAALRLFDLGQKDIAIFTEGINMGTSRNTGSDKQTYYKLSLEGDDPDSVVDMAQTYFDGGSMHGDIALVEAAMSAREYFHLVEIGVPFPHNRYGEYVGYRTDHDPKKRATSAGPLTSRFMTEKLEQQIKDRGIAVYDHMLAVRILKNKNSACGFIALHDGNRFVYVNCTNIIFATGGPAGMYEASVYPHSQNGSTGIAFMAGCKGVNLTESQYGIASIRFRWNLSGTYQQVLPRYISTTADGKDEKEFLNGCFSSPSKMLDAIFLKGYQWPFDPRKIENEGSSLIDLLVYNETQIKGRRVYLDFTKNADAGGTGFDPNLLGRETYGYLERSGALFGRPIDRLEKMNEPAIRLYKDNGIDLRNEYLEIDVCAQHNNGGLLGDIWYESNIKHFFPVGEVNGVFGVYRPGGSALNSTQVGGARAAAFISGNYRHPPLEMREFLALAQKEMGTVLYFIDKAKQKNDGKIPVAEMDKRIRTRMTKFGAHIRDAKKVETAFEECRKELENFEDIVMIDDENDIEMLFRTHNNLVCQFVYLGAIKEYIGKNGVSRGSFLITGNEGILPAQNLPGEFRYIGGEDKLKGKINEIRLLNDEKGYRIGSRWVDVRKIPESDNWFENVWRDYREGRIIK